MDGCGLCRGRWVWLAVGIELSRYYIYTYVDANHQNTPPATNPSRRQTNKETRKEPATQPTNMPDLHSLPAGTRPTNAVRNNGPDKLVLERAKLRELAEGWPCYR
jgi:hypothetical protein